MLVLLFRPAGGDFDVVVGDGEMTTLVLERVSDRVELALCTRYLRIDLLYLGLNFVASSFFFGLELLILRTLFDLSFGFSRVALDTVEIFRVAADKLALHSLPGPLD